MPSSNDHHLENGKQPKPVLPSQPFEKLTLPRSPALSTPTNLLTAMDKVRSLTPKLTDIVMRYFGNHPKSWNKSNGTPVSVADEKVNVFLLRELPLIINAPVVSEEIHTIYEERRNYKLFWLIDPIDGTRDFISGKPFFGISIALISARRPVLGLVVLPAEKTEFFAIAGQGAFKQKASEEKVRLRPLAPRTPPIMFYSWENQERPEYEKELKLIEIFKVTDSHLRKLWAADTYRYCKLAAGEVDFAARLTESCEWDLAAVDCILREAGCQLLHLQTLKPLSYNTESMQFPGTVAFRAGTLKGSGLSLRDLSFVRQNR